MAYIGNTPTTQSFISGTDYFNGTGSQTAFTLSRTVASQNDVEAVVNNVVQQPNAGYTISGTTITFTSAPSAGTQNVYVRYLSTTTQSIAPAQGTVGWNQLNTDTQQDLGISFKNRIINGAMMIDQRNAGAAVTVNSAARIYGVDRFFGYGQAADGVFTIDQDTDAPTGFINSTKITTTTADASVGASQFYLFGQSIEGTNITDLAWGTASAKTVTLSFWVKSSLFGTFGGALTNSAANRSYPFTYTISSANTWEQKSITIAGDTTGTWLTTTGIGIDVWFDLGCGSSNIGTAGSWAAAAYYGATGDTKLISTNGATWYITGVQLEVGTQATTFTMAGGSYGAELALCQRYYIKFVGRGTSDFASIAVGTVSNSNYAELTCFLPVELRTKPTASFGGQLYLGDGSAYPALSSIGSNWGGRTAFYFSGVAASSTLTIGRGVYLYANTASTDFFALSAEL